MIYNSYKKQLKINDPRLGELDEPYQFFVDVPVDSKLLIPGIGRRSRKILLPEDFDNWDLPVNIFRTGLRSYSIDKTVDDFMPVTTETLWVDGVNGDDSNPGTEAGPFKTLTQAHTASSGSSLIKVAAGEYPDATNLPTTFSFTKDIIFEGVGGTFFFDRNKSFLATGRKIGFRNFESKFDLRCRGSSTYVFDKPLCTSVDRNLRFENTCVGCVFGATGSNLTGEDVLSYGNSARGIEVDCVFDTIGSAAADNCSTGHIDTRIVSVNCRYRNGFRTVHDVNNSKRLMFGGEVKQSQGTFSENNSFCVGMGFPTLPGSGIIWLYGVDTDDTGMDNAALNSLFVGSSDGTSSIYYDNETLFKSIGGTGTVELFEKQYAS